MSQIRVGLSTTVIEPGLTQGQLDGIGVYTQALLQGLGLAVCSVTGLSFPKLLSKRGRGYDFRAGRPMPHSFVYWTLRDAVYPGKAPAVETVDLFHATDYRIVNMQCPVVATLHDAIPIKFPEWVNPGLRSLKNWMQKNAARKAEHVIAVSRFAITELVECFGIDERRITVVHNGVGAVWHQTPELPAVESTLRRFGLRPGYFLFVGTLQPRKNVDRIIDAYLGLPAELRRSRQLVIVGRAGWQCDELVSRLQTLKQQEQSVVWLDKVGGEDTLREIYAGAGVFVFPSLYEGFGIPVAEAFASGVPVVTSNTTSLPEVSRGAALEVNPTSVSEIGTAMLDLVRDEALRNRCIEAGKRRAAELTWERTARETAAVYRSVLAGRG